MRVLGAAVAALCLTACNANYYAVHRQGPIGELPAMTVIDAKQRVIVSAAVPLAKKAEEGSAPGSGFRYCAEPSPDAFSVLAQSASASGSFGQGADPKAVQAALNAAFSSSEQGASFARTQTINMLREVMYRTCERYLNGALGELEMPVQAVRDQRMMISALAIEQLTSAASARSIAIGANASASAAANEAAVKVADAQKVRNDKQAALDKLNAADPKCDALQKDADDNKTVSDPAKLDQCKAAKDALDTAKHDLATLEKVVTGAGPVSASTTVSTPQTLPGSDPTTVRRELDEVAETVGKIVKLNYSNEDEITLMCLKAFQVPKTVAEPRAGAGTAGQAAAPTGTTNLQALVTKPETTASSEGATIQDTCIKLVMARVDASQQKAKADAEEAKQRFQAAKDAVTAPIDRLFNAFFAKVAEPDGKSVDTGKLGQLLDNYFKGKKPVLPDRVKALRAQVTVDGLKTAFTRLPQIYQEDLAK